jgi:hypothetical protein
MDKDDCTCSICDEIFFKPRRLPCGHFFCDTCIRNWIRIRYPNVTCPLCRREILQQDSLEYDTNLQRECEQFYIQCELCKDSVHPSVTHICPSGIVKCEHSECMWVGRRKKNCLMSCPVDRLKRIHKNIVKELRKENDLLRSQISTDVKRGEIGMLSQFADDFEGTDSLFNQFE